jgi:2-dehydro-3-deoxyphosphogluconate aldolase/(4S)-4-hydroxy-2-oxoglutarate aldolase
LLPDGSVVPVLVLRDVDEALAVAEILVTAGLPLEITLRTPAALDAIRAIREGFPDAVVGAGTVLSAAQAEAAIEAGADFGVSPGLTPDLAEAIRGLHWPFLPGIATASEAMAAAAAGFEAVKFFPAEASGGLAFVTALGSVLPDLRLCPTGGIGPESAGDYLALPNVFAVGGSWLLKRHGDGGVDLDATRAAAVACSQRLSG